MQIILSGDFVAVEHYQSCTKLGQKAFSLWHAGSEALTTTVLASLTASASAAG
jgi:hypothetical protein